MEKIGEIEIVSRRLELLADTLGTCSRDVFDIQGVPSVSVKEALTLIDTFSRWRLWNELPKDVPLGLEELSLPRSVLLVEIFLVA